MDRSVYIDNNATTAVAPEVTESMLPFFTEKWGNPSSMHTFGGGVKKHIDAAREQVAALIGAEHPNEIIFTSEEVTAGHLKMILPDRLVLVEHDIPHIRKEYESVLNNSNMIYLWNGSDNEDSLSYADYMEYAFGNNISVQSQDTVKQTFNYEFTDKKKYTIFLSRVSVR